MGGERPGRDFPWKEPSLQITIYSGPNEMRERRKEDRRPPTGGSKKGKREIRKNTKTIERPSPKCLGNATRCRGGTKGGRAKK